LFAVADNTVNEASFKEETLPAEAAMITAPIDNVADSAGRGLSFMIAP
jgi:hypothetical protein